MEPRLKRNAKQLLKNIYAVNHVTTEAVPHYHSLLFIHFTDTCTQALFLETPQLCNHMWRDWEGLLHWHRSPLTVAVCYNDVWLVEFLITKTECDTSFVEVNVQVLHCCGPRVHCACCACPGLGSSSLQLVNLENLVWM
jgi:hypothetical protein